MKNLNTPLITIISPIYNCAALIEEFIEKIESQSFADFELILVDGGSTDGTIEIVTAAAKRIENIKYISESDDGIYDAMNKGVRLAKGAWLYFIGSDDSFFRPNTLEEISKHLTLDTDIVYGGIYNASEDTIASIPYSFSDVFAGALCHQAVFYRREFACSIGEYDTKYKICADRDFNNRCFHFAKRIVYVDMIVCKYGGNGVSSKTRDDRFHIEKYLRIQQFSKKRLTSKLFRHCRYDFYRRSKDQIYFDLAERLQYRLLYLYHGTMSKVGL